MHSELTPTKSNVNSGLKFKTILFSRHYSVINTLWRVLVFAVIVRSQPCLSQLN